MYAGTRLDITPSAEGIQHFLTSIIKKVEPKSQHGVPSFDWMCRGIKILEEALTFEYSDFHLSPHHSLRIDALTDGFVEQGRLTKGPARECHWLGVTLVKKLIDAVFEDAVRNGSRNWDVTIHMAISVLLTSALQCRSGDIAKSRYNTQPLPCLVYKDISLKLRSGVRTLTTLKRVLPYVMRKARSESLH